MIRYLYCFLILASLLSCQKDKEQAPEGERAKPAESTTLAFTTASYHKKTSLPCRDTACTYVDIKVPVAHYTPVVADSINKKIFNTVRGIVYWGEKPSEAKTFQGIADTFVGSYDNLVKKYPEEASYPWEAKVNGSITYQSDKVLGVKLTLYTFTGGAHGYAGERSLLFDLSTGRSLTTQQIFTDVKTVTALAEKKFREKYKIPAGKSINATGLMFDKDRFILPQNIFFQKNGLLLYYNPYEAGSFAEGAKEVLLPYDVMDDYLKVK